MNSIVRIILRGLLSGEIKANPEVFKYLRELSDRQLQCHSRILRMVRPAASVVASRAPERSEDSSACEAPLREPSQKPGSRSPQSSPLDRGWLAVASLSSGRGIRAAAFLLITGVVMGFGVSTVHASAPVAAGDHLTAVAVAFADGGSETFNGVLSMLHPFPGTLLIVSGALLLSLLAGAGWRWFCRNKLFVMRPYEVALQELESTPYRAAQGRIWNSRRAVLNILYEYVEAQFRLHLPGLRREALLRALTLQGAPLTPSQRALLRDVLETPVDEPATHPEQVADLSEKAARFVWATACCRAPKGLVVSPAQ